MKSVLSEIQFVKECAVFKYDFLYNYFLEKANFEVKCKVNKVHNEFYDRSIFFMTIWGYLHDIYRKELL